MSYQEYKQKKRQESDRQAQLSYGELFNLNSKKAALLGLSQIIFAYVLIDYLLEQYVPVAFYFFWFVGSFVYDTFGCKLRYWLRRVF
ncbi:MULTISPECIES: hypothetical protein [Cysteiniphilum]|uniref:hypothetical protein n=1 Tax=Cysteiniphilum TaxID=2056696 RepID=UPI00177BB394|nr:MULTISPECIES: hypothetical protein [Cysteiniphilum]